MKFIECCQFITIPKFCLHSEAKSSGAEAAKFLVCSIQVLDYERLKLMGDSQSRLEGRKKIANVSEFLFSGSLFEA